MYLPPHLNFIEFERFSNKNNGYYGKLDLTLSESKKNFEGTKLFILGGGAPKKIKSVRFDFLIKYGF